MEFLQLLGVVGSLLGFAAIGAALRISGLVRAEDAKPINTVLLYAALPALIFTAVQRAPIEPSLAEFPLIGWGVVLAGLLVAWLLARLLRLKGPTAGAFMLVAVFGNTGYVGYPVAQALLGEPGLVRAVFSDVFGNTMAVVIVGTFVAAHYGEHEGRISLVREIVTYPPFIALAAALLLHGVSLPQPVTSWLDALAKVVVPMIMVSLGLTLRPRKVRGHLAAAFTAAGLKLLLLPALALGIGLLVLRDPGALSIAVLQAGVPSMMLAMIIGERFKLDVDFIASTILVTMVGAVVTIPVFQLLTG